MNKYGLWISPLLACAVHYCPATPLLGDNSIIMGGGGTMYEGRLRFQEAAVELRLQYRVIKKIF